MLLTVQRLKRTTLSVSGEMTNAGAWLAWTLENAEYAIPAGTYPITLYPSPKFGRLMPLINDVPGRSNIEIHWANTPDDLEGCVGVGTMHSADAIWNSREKFAELYPIIEAAVNSEGCDIQIIDPVSSLP